MHIKIVLILSFLFSEMALADVYKCTNKNGKVALQDKPCEGLGPEFKEEAVKLDSTAKKSGIEIWDIKTAQGNSYVIGLPSEWKVETGVKDGVSTMRSVVKGADPVTVLISFIPISKLGGDKKTAFTSFMQNMLGQRVGNAKEKIITSIDVKPAYLKDAFGRLVLLFDEELAKIKDLGEGEYLYTLTGAIATEPHLIYVSILSNQPDSENTIKAYSSVSAIGESP